jgi:hypothetical protein
MNCAVLAFDELRVVTTAKWVAEDLAKAGTIPVVHDYGMDLPASTEGTAWWCSGRHAARLMASGVDPGFLSAGPTFTADLPWRFRRRSVWAGRLKDMPRPIGPAFYKPAEAKLESLPAKEYPYWGQFVQAAHHAKLDKDDFVQVSSLMEYTHEFRCFIADGQVTAISPYLVNGVTWESLDPETVPGAGTAWEVAQGVADYLGADQPPGYVLDVGADQSGRFSVIEANASWSSNPYWAAADGVIKSILASQSTDPAHARWRWEPANKFRQYAQPLPVNP